MTSVIRQPYEHGLPLPPLDAPRPLKIAHVRTLVQDQSFQPKDAVALDLTGATAPAQNALLKFLEEPPGSPTIHLYHELEWEPLPTVVSRCNVHQRPLLLTIETKKMLLGHPSTPRDFDWDRPLADIKADLSPERGVVSALLTALAERDLVQAILASKGFNRESATLLARVIRSHLTGNGDPQLAFARAHPTTLEQWCRLLETLRSPGLSVRWGVLTLLSR